MIRTDKFVISQRPYAANLGLMVWEERLRAGVPAYWYVQVNAVWFRRRGGAVSACLGYLWDHQKQKPGSVQEFLERHTDGRYGGHCLARLDHTGYWAEGGSHPEVIKRHLEILEPMLANVGVVPDGHTGWWHF